MMAEKINKYLSMCWYDYGCKDKKQIQRIIEREIKNHPEMDYKQLKIHIKRTCQAEL